LKTVKKKVLIITYNWPPAGGIGVLRCLKFAKYLRDFGWEPVIYTVKDAQYPYFDDSNDKDIPDGITILKKPIIEPFQAFKLITGRKKNVPLNNIVHVRDKQSLFDKLGIWVRGNYFIPDARFLWIKPSVKFLTAYLKDNPVDAILTDGPPHTNTVIGCEVSKNTNIPWLADFQDPWTQVDYYQLFKIGKKADKKHKALEQDTFKVAKKITIASPNWKKEIEEIGAKNVDVIYYGYDDDDFNDVELHPDKKFSISHAGLLGFDRNPENLLIAIKELIDELPSLKTDLEIKLIGQVDYSILQLIKELDLESVLNAVGTISRKQTLSEISNSWLLLLPLNKAKNAKGRMPGKLYEYIKTKRPIINLGPLDSDVSKIIDDYQLGVNFEYSNVKDLKTYLKDNYQNYYLKNNFSALNSISDTSTFSNKNQTKKIAQYLNEISE